MIYKISASALSYYNCNTKEFDDLDLTHCPLVMSYGITELSSEHTDTWWQQAIT